MWNGTPLDSDRGKYTSENNHNPEFIYSVIRKIKPPEDVEHLTEFIEHFCNNNTDNDAEIIDRIADHIISISNTSFLMLNKCRFGEKSSSYIFTNKILGFVELTPVFFA